MNLLQQSDIIDEVTEEPWLRNEMYILKKEDQHLLLSKDAWLNDRIMDAAQELICKEIGTDESYQSVLNSERKTIDPFHPVTQEHVQLSFMMELIIGFSALAQMNVYKSVTVFVQV